MDETLTAVAETGRAAKGTALQLPRAAPKTKKMAKSGARKAKRGARFAKLQAKKTITKKAPIAKRKLKKLPK